jgi:hypothetical protein
LLQSLIVRAFFSGCFHMVVKNPYITTACAGKAWQSSMSVWLFDLVWGSSWGMIPLHR